MEGASTLLENTNSVIAVVAGVVVIVGIVAYLVSKGKLNFRSDKFSIESAKQNTKALLQECRTSCSLLAAEFIANYITKYPDKEYQIKFVCELVLNRIEEMLHYNKISTKEDYIDMRFTDIRAIVDSNKIEGGNYNEDFYKKLYDEFTRIIKQIVLIKKHYCESD